MNAHDRHELNHLRDRVARLRRVKALVDAGRMPGPVGLDDHLRQRLDELRALEQRLGVLL